MNGSAGQTVQIITYYRFKPAGRQNLSTPEEYMSDLIFRERERHIGLPRGGERKHAFRYVRSADDGADIQAPVPSSMKTDGTACVKNEKSSPESSGRSSIFMPSSPKKRNPDTEDVFQHIEVVFNLCVSCGYIRPTRCRGAPLQWRGRPSQFGSVRSRASWG